MSHYETLGIESRATPEDIKAAYRRASMKHHPDRAGGDVEKFKEVQLAYEVLIDPKRRADYDAGGEGAKGASLDDRILEIVGAMLRVRVLSKPDFHGDPIQYVREMLVKAGQQGAESALNNRRAAEHAQKVARSIVRVNGEGNPLAELAQAYADECLKRLAADTDNLKTVSAALQFLNDFQGFAL